MSASATTGSVEKSLIDLYLEEQRRLTAVEKFTRHHEAGAPSGDVSRFRDLIPLGRPGAGQQYAFEVDLDRCSGCKACVTACHSLNGLEEGESWRSVGLLQGVTHSHSWQQTVTTACHHCLDPGCLNGCPVLAYEKDPRTGIVRHLDDQCIGCQYCVMKCPYEVPRYSARQGIVRKCDMCSERLKVGEAPACAQACPSGAIRVRIIDQTAVRPDSPLVPTAPSSRISYPTTKYVRQSALPEDARAGEAPGSRPQPAHTPLVFMLALTQLSVGIPLLLALAPGGAGGARGGRLLDWLSAGSGLTGILLSILHLGRPRQAWRSFLGLRRSWLSREIVLFGLYLPLVLLLPAAAEARLTVWRSLAALVGCAAVFSSMMVYADTSREFWARRYTGAKFGGTMVLLGLGAMNFAGAVQGTGGVPPGWVLPALLAAALLKLSGEAAFVIGRKTAGGESLARSARLMRGRLAGLTAWRFACGLSALVLAGTQALSHVPSAAFELSLAALVLFVAGELFERLLFFKAVAPVGMPGGYS